jgi:hypothetical protein
MAESTCCFCTIKKNDLVISFERNTHNRFPKKCNDVLRRVAEIAGENPHCVTANQEIEAKLYGVSFKSGM